MMFIVDGHHLAHRWWHITKENDEGNIDDAMERFMQDLEYCIDRFAEMKISQWVIVWEHQGELIRNWIDPEYECKRTREPQLEYAVKSAREAATYGDTWKNVIAPYGWESKDAIASIAKGYSGKVIIFSSARDIRQSLEKDRVTLLRTFKRTTGETTWLTYDGFVAEHGFEPSRLPDYYCLVGSNDINPCFGIGEKTATGIVQSLGADTPLKEAHLVDMQQAKKETFLAMLGRYEQLQRLFKLVDDLDWPKDLDDEPF